MSKATLKPHIYRELINDLRDVIKLDHPDRQTAYGMLLLPLKDAKTLLSQLGAEEADVLLRRLLVLTDGPYKNSQNLRAIINSVVGEFVEPNHESKRNKSCY